MRFLELFFICAHIFVWLRGHHDISNWPPRFESKKKIVIPLIRGYESNYKQQTDTFSLDRAQFRTHPVLRRVISSDLIPNFYLRRQGNGQQWVPSPSRLLPAIFSPSSLPPPAIQPPHSLPPFPCLRIHPPFRNGHIVSLKSPFLPQPPPLWHLPSPAILPNAILPSIRSLPIRRFSSTDTRANLPASDPFT